jgi:predicted enzyme related to lactoylglutathione lyase
MSDVQVRGRFIWHELMTTDPAAALLLYPRIVGWDVSPSPFDPSYTLMMLGGIPRAGVMRLPEDAAAMGAPPSWTCYVGTPDVDATARQTEALGGRILRSPTDIPGACRFAILQDPLGAVFAGFQPLTEPLPETPPERGEFCWHELASADAGRAFDFYAALFGWQRTEAMDMGPLGTYQMFGNGGPSLGGMYTLPRDLDIPSHWLPYASVDDSRRAAAAMESGGGRVISAPMQVPGGAWVSKLVDPQGAVFAVHSLDVAPERPAPARTTPTRAASPRRVAPAARARPTKAKPRPARAKARPAKTKVRPARAAARPRKAATARKSAAPAGTRRKPRKSAPARPAAGKRAGKPAKRSSPARKTGKKAAVTRKRSAAGRKRVAKPTAGRKRPTPRRKKAR